VIPSRPQENDPDQVAKLVQLGSEAGFDVTFDLSGIYNGYPVDDVRVSSDDNHPNAMGHRLIYERLYRELNAHRELFQNPSASTTTESRDELNQPSSTNAP
jgi:lysophospholipase L1-like esterase